MSKLLNSWVSLLLIWLVGAGIYFGFYHGKTEEQFDDSFIMGTDGIAVPERGKYAIELLDIPEKSKSPHAKAIIVHLETLDNEIEPKMDLHSQPRGILLRELIRQALLMSLREEFGLITRDVTLGDPIPTEANENNATIYFDGPSVNEGGYHVQLCLKNGDSQETFAKFWIPLGADSGPGFDKLAESLELAARTGFREAFEHVGFTPLKQQQKSGSGKLPSEVSTQLGEMNCFTQFAAIRTIHNEIRQHGNTLERLGALVRGYSHLGQLATFHWNASYKAYRARALLYARRMEIAFPDNQSTQWHSIYAYALAGVHHFALQKVDEANAPKMAESKKANDRRPAWADLIVSYLHFDRKKLTKATENESPNTQLAAYLAYLAAGACDARAANVMSKDTGLLTDELKDSAARLLAVCPDCFEIYDTMHNYGGLGTKRADSIAAPIVFQQFTPKRLHSIPNINTAWIENGDLIKTARKLIDVGQTQIKPGEPSWGVLGSMLRETHFAQTYRRLSFLSTNLGVSTEAEASTLYPSVMDHPYAPIVEAFAAFSRNDMQRLIAIRDEFASTIRMPDIVPSAWHAISWINFSKQRSDNIWKVFWSHFEALSDDLSVCVRLNHNDPGSYAFFSDYLLRVSPHDPSGAAYFVQANPDQPLPRLEEWKQKFGDKPLFVAKLAARLANQKDPEAEKWLKKNIELSPGMSSYFALAHYYKYHKDYEQWQQTLEEYLTIPVDGLQHAITRENLALHFMRLGDYTKALPYAVAAAQTWRSASMWYARECYEALEHWENAELWARRDSERYDNKRDQWYTFCLRTGKGNLQAAKLWWEDYLDSLGENRSAYSRGQNGLILLYQGKYAEAFDEFHLTIEKANNAFYGIHCALAAEEVGNAEIRDKALEKAIKAYNWGLKMNPYKETGIAVTEWIRQTLQSRKVNGLESISERIQKYQEDEKFSQHRSDFFCRVGWCLLLIGEQENGLKLLEQSIQCSDSAHGRQLANSLVTHHSQQ